MQPLNVAIPIKTAPGKPESGQKTTSAELDYPDHLGSTNIVADEQGNVINELQYYPFGRPRYQQTITNGTAYKYTSKELDTESELMYYEARHYDPVIGRFVSVDPLFAEIGRKPRRNELIYKLIYKSFITAPQSQNLQSYSYNAPITHLDRNGLWGGRNSQG